MATVPDRQMHLNLFIFGCGHHKAAWRHPDSPAERIGDITYFEELARTAERGELWPAMDETAIAKYNQMRHEATAVHPITTSGVALQMVHRILAFGILFSVLFAGWKTLRQFAARSLPGRLTIGWLTLIFVQILLGAATIWTNKSADIATAHVAVGALSLATGAMLVLTTPRSFSNAPAFRERIISEPNPIAVTT